MDFDFTTETITPDTTNLLTIGGPGALEVPVGTTAERPVTGLSNGALRYNTSLNVLEGYVNSSWSTVITGGVLSVTGTTNQITASPTTGAVVLSIPNTFITPQYAGGSIGTIVATGTTQGTAASITVQYVEVTSAPSNTGVILPTPVAGQLQAVTNDDPANPVFVYPHSGGNIDGGTTNAALKLDPGATVVFSALNTTKWITTQDFITSGTGINVVHSIGSYAINLATPVAAANGGTGFASYAVGDILYASAATTLSKLADVAAGSYLRSGGVTTAPLWSTTTLPNSATTGDLMYASASNTYSNLADVATGNALISGGVGVAPSWGKIGLTTHVSGTLPIANGGTNSSTALSGSSIMVSNGTSVIQGAAGTTTTVLHGNAAGAPTYGAVVLTTDVSGILPLANGGTNANLTAVNGGAVYSTGSALAITAAGTAGQVLTSNGAAAPTWQAAAATLQLYKENPSSPTAPSATGTNAIAMLSGSAASATNSSAMGDGTSASLWSSHAYANGKFATAGDAQGIRVVARVTTTNNTDTEMFLDGSGAAQRLVIPDNSSWNYFIQIVARRTDATGGYSAWNFVGLINRDSGVGTTVNSASRTNIDKNGIGSDPTCTADTTNGSLKITVKGNNSQTIRWVATINISQVTN